MPIRSNGYYNDPGIAQVAANLSGLFAPPSGTDAAGWAAANAKNAEASRLAQLFAAGATPSEQAALAGIQNYGATPQGFTYQIDQNTATTRRGQDIGAQTSLSNNAADNARYLQLGAAEDATRRYGIDVGANTSLTNNTADNLAKRYGIDVGAQTSLANNAADNQRAILTNRADNGRQVVTSLFQPLNQGQVRPAVDADILAAAGLPSFPTLPEVAGAAKPMTDSEVKGGIISGLSGNDQRLVAMEGVPVEQVVMGGQPTIQYRTAAADANAQPYIKPTADTSTPLAKLIAERDALPPGDPRRSAYDANIAALGRGQKQSAYDEASDKDNADLNKTLFENATKSLVDQGTYKAILAAVDNPTVDQGTLAGATLALRKTLNAFGVDGGNTAPAEMLNALGSQLSLRLRDPSSGAGLPGSMSDSDREYLRTMTVSLGNTPQANRLLAQYFLATQQRNVDLNDLRQNYVAKNGKIDEGFKTEMANYLKNNDPTVPVRNTLSGAAPAAGGATGAAPAASPTRLRFDENGNQVQ